MKTTTAILIIIVGLIIFWFIWLADNATQPTLTPSPTLSETPEPTPAHITTKENDDIIVLDSPLPEAIVSSPLLIKGEARGNWFFEASFPVTLTDWDGRIIAQHFATAQDDWMTEDFVPFEAKLEFDSPYHEGDPDFMRRGSLILHKDNPSGLPEHDDALEITVWFGPAPRPTNQGQQKLDGCIITGCSSHICSDEEAITTCQFRPEYSCYKNATCERQSDGQCGWTVTSELTACLNRYQ